MKTPVKIITKFSLILCISLLPVFLYAQGGPGPPPPPEGVPFDTVSWALLAGAIALKLRNHLPKWNLK